MSLSLPSSCFRASTLGATRTFGEKRSLGKEEGKRFALTFYVEHFSEAGAGAASPDEFRRGFAVSKERANLSKQNYVAQR